LNLKVLDPGQKTVLWTKQPGESPRSLKETGRGAIEEKRNCKMVCR